jgi:2-methylcitrate dehydratase PrpD
VAIALLDGRVNFESFEPDARARTAGLRRRIAVAATEPYVSNYPRAWGGEVAVSLRDNRRVTAARTHCKGDPELALSADEMVAKSRDLLRFAGVADAEGIIRAVLAMADGAPVPALPIV